MSTSPRFPAQGLRVDNTHGKMCEDYQNPAYAASIAIATKPNATHTTVQIGPLTGNLTLTIGVGSATTPPFVGDRITLIAKSDASIRTITFGTGFQPSATLATVASKTVSAQFVFDGTGWQELSRGIQA